MWPLSRNLEILIIAIIPTKFPLIPTYPIISDILQFRCYNSGTSDISANFGNSDISDDFNNSGTSDISDDSSNSDKSDFPAGPLFPIILAFPIILEILKY